MPISKTPDKINKSVQEMGNLSFDTEYNLNAIEALVYNPTTSQVDRMVQPGQTLPTSGLNASYEYDYSNPASIVIQQTIGSDVYQQTITISAGVAAEGAWIKL